MGRAHARSFCVLFDAVVETAKAAKELVNAVMLKPQLGEPTEGEYPLALAERSRDIRDLVATPGDTLRASQ